MARCPGSARQFFVDDAGECSCMRLLVFVILLFVLALWAWGCFMAGAYIPLGYAEAGIISSAIAGKAVQARFEYGGGPNFPPVGGVGARAGDGDPAPSPPDRLCPRNLEEGGRHV